MPNVQTLLLSAVTLFGTVVLVCSCLFFKRFRKNKGNGSRAVSDKNKSENTERDVNGQITGITNTAFTVGNEGGDIYENDANVYDYAKNDRPTKKQPGRQPNTVDQDNISPLYADAEDMSTRFYFTLERGPPGNTGNTKEYTGTPVSTGTGDDTYVIAIPDNIYDKPEDGNTEELLPNDQGTSQFYYTLEECSQQNENKEVSTPNLATEQNSHPSDGTLEGTSKNEKRDAVAIDIEDHYNQQDTDEDTYVITIPNEVDEMKHKPIKLADNEISASPVDKSRQEQDSKEVYSVNIPNDMDESLKLSPKIKGDGHSRYVETAEDKTDGYSRDEGIEVDKREEYSKNTEIDEENDKRYSRKLRMDEDAGGRLSQNVMTKKDKSGTDENMYSSDGIYENVSVGSYSKKKVDRSQKILHEKSFSDKKAQMSVGNCNTGEGKENIEDLDDEIVAQNKSKCIMKKQVSGKDTSVISSDTLASDSKNNLSRSNTSHNDEDYCDDDIYENWEENIVGRAKTVSDESGNELYANGSGEEAYVSQPGDDPYVNESSDELYLNENFLVTNDQDPGSRCKSLYENLTEFRQSLVIQTIR